MELAFVVSLATLREVLKAMSIDGRRPWIASDPGEAMDIHGNPLVMTV